MFDRDIRRRIGPFVPAENALPAAGAILYAPGDDAPAVLHERLITDPGLKSLGDEMRFGAARGYFFTARPLALIAQNRFAAVPNPEDIVKRSTTLMKRTRRSLKWRRRMAVAARASMVGTSPAQARTTSGPAPLVAPGPASRLLISAVTAACTSFSGSGAPSA
jgi:hypothetical protein